MSIYSKVRDLLIGDTTLQNLLHGTTANKKVFFHYPKGTTIEENVPCITYYFIEAPDFPIFWRDIRFKKSGTLFIDIWSKDNLNDIYERVIELFRGISFFTDLVQAVDVFENDTGIYHKHINMRIIGG